MIAEWRVTEVREVSSPGEEAWLITYQPPDGAPVLVSYVPKDAIEMRAAEFGLASFDEALEVLLYAPLLASAQASGELDMLTPSLVDVDSARKQVVEQLATCKKKYGVVTTAAAAGTARAAKAVDPLQVIRDQTRIDPIKTAAIRMGIDRFRLSNGG